jgi:hypothetical protein
MGTTALVFLENENQAFKGQIISECLFDVFKFSKKPTKNLTNFCPSTKKWSNQQSKGTFFNTMIIWAI